MDIKKKLLPLGEAAILVSVIVGVTFAAYYIYHMTATVDVSTEVASYKDAGCSQLLPPDTHHWGNIRDGDTKNFWIKNEGNVLLNVTVTILNEVDCTVAVAPSAVNNLGVGATHKITLTISTSATGGSTISWDVDIDSEEA